ncbi:MULTISPECIES: GNAT family N-acetyltransferase [Brucella/Ochrobactrum group]|uniref:GNAT family N-acetyltransferase n=1 Tax=Brucella/Ochrobactrum group TaxID=2826938 RepID=UPI001C03D552|nr:GNAT family N-acetyltransferase [Brucella sp. NBRC 12950]QWK80399.1 GNAT family N-acetyltransferase [Ochrobactrum sp. BTU1]GLU29092.1 GNAT family acetyltransferase [Brucella sp. NBRC 12950]
MIETERLILRKPVAGDFEPFYEMFKEPVVTAHIGGVLTRTEAWARFLRDIGHWTLEGFGQFIIIEKSTSSFVGKMGFAKFERDLGRCASTSIECTWTLTAAFHGRGYAREAAISAHRWFDEHHINPTACLIGEANIPSLKLAGALGYEEIDRLRRPAGEAIVLERKIRQRSATAK